MKTNIKKIVIKLCKKLLIFVLVFTMIFSMNVSTAIKIVYANSIVNTEEDLVDVAIIEEDKVDKKIMRIVKKMKMRQK